MAELAPLEAGGVGDPLTFLLLETTTQRRAGEGLVPLPPCNFPGIMRSSLPSAAVEGTALADPKMRVVPKKPPPRGEDAGDEGYIYCEG